MLSVFSLSQGGGCHATVNYVNFSKKLRGIIDDDGHITEKSVLKIVDDLGLASTLREILFVEPIKGGGATARTFLVKAGDRALYCFKEVASDCKTKECRHLETVQDSLGGQIGATAQYDPGFFPLDIRRQLNKLPKVCLLKAFASYRDDEGKSHTIEILDAAQGGDFKFALYGSEVSVEDFVARSRAIGHSMGLFHRATMEKSVQQALELLPMSSWIGFVHGSLHLRNVCCDEQLNVFLIDNESMKANLIFKDVYKFMSRLLLDKYGVEDKRFQGVESFVEGYVGSYPQKLQERIRMHCYTLMMRHFLKSADRMPEEDKQKFFFTELSDKKSLIDLAAEVALLDFDQRKQEAFDFVAKKIAAL